jgi:Ca-activated chloride channel homolog
MRILLGRDGAGGSPMADRRAREGAVRCAPSVPIEPHHERPQRQATVSLAFAAPAFLWLLATLPIIVLLHFLRARTRRVEVSAVFLWERAREVAERRRRFTPTWSLLLQLLAATLAALALAQPDLRLQGPPDLVVVIDASASMAAVDPEGARMERAREAVRQLAADAGRVAVVRAGTEPRLAFGFGDDRAALEAALEAFTPGDRISDLDRALALALDLAGDDDEARARVALIGDDPGPERPGVTRIDVGGSGENIGIVGFDLGIQQAFVAVASNAVGPRSVGVELRQDGALLASTDLLVPSGDQASVTFPIDVGSGVVEARLVGLPGSDALSLDDVAYAGQRALRVVVDADVESVMRALGAVPGVATRLTGLARTTPADVRVLTGIDPDAAPTGDLILLPEPRAEPEYVGIAEWDRADPLMRFVDLREVVVGLAPDGGGPSLDEPGWRVLASSADLRPVLRWRDDERGRVLQFLVHPRQTDLVFRPAFPTLMANVLERFRGEARVALGATGDAGAPITLPGPVEVGGRQTTASLLALEQTRLPGPGPDDRDVPGALLPVERPTPLAAWLLALAALALVIEWWLWSRGPGATTRRPRSPRRLPRRA